MMRSWPSCSNVRRRVLPPTTATITAVSTLPFIPHILPGLLTLLLHLGQAVIQARESDNICSNEDFLTNYKNCIQCAGPENVGIWQYYGDTLSDVGQKCDLATKPEDGMKDDVGPAIPAQTGGSSSSTPASTPVPPGATEGRPALHEWRRSFPNIN
ncbi:hypothetical protein IMZ48_06425 [Candidatus Bathyarchaeota archaeon]|nr:hypothetical protein [Candidatus Bathyarchaeota archaeon]